MPLPAEGIALLCNCSMIGSKGVVKFFILYKGCSIVRSCNCSMIGPRQSKVRYSVQRVFNCSIVLLYYYRLQGLRKSIILCKRRPKLWNIVFYSLIMPKSVSAISFVNNDRGLGGVSKTRREQCKTSRCMQETMAYWCKTKCVQYTCTRQG